MTIEPSTKMFLNSLEAKGNRSARLPTVEEARRQQAAMQAVDVPKPRADIVDFKILGGPTGDIDIRIVRPIDASGMMPVVMYFHGGGWVVGDKETHDRLIREIAVGSRAAVVFVDYSRSPEARFPIAIEQAYSATQWVARHGAEQRLDSQRLALVGDSSGGNMAAAVALMAKQLGGPPIRCQVLFFPTTDANFDTVSYRQFADGPFLTRELMQWFWNQYAPDAAAREEITASPLRATIEQLRGLPPALIITDENDVLRDEGEAFSHSLIEAGVKVTAVRYLGTIHAFVLLNAISQAPAARAAISQANDYLRTALE
jgi:acetyl esterase